MNMELEQQSDIESQESQQGLSSQQRIPNGSSGFLSGGCSPVLK